MRLAMAAMLAARVWAATMTGPQRHSGGILRPETSTIGKLSMESVTTMPRLFHSDDKKESAPLSLMQQRMVDFRAFEPMFPAPEARADPTLARHSPFHPWVPKPGFDARRDPI